MSEYITSIDYVWKNDNSGNENALVVVVNNSQTYQQMHDDETFDERVFFYFKDDAEFKRSFDPNDDEFEFRTIREIA